MFTVVYAPPGGGSAITANNVQSIAIAPNNDRYAPQSVMLNFGVGGGGQFGAGTIIPIASITSISVAVV